MSNGTRSFVRPPKRKSFDWGTGALAAGIGIVVVVLFFVTGFLFVGWFKSHASTCMIENKYTVVKSSQTNNGTTVSNEKRVDTSCGVFTVNDSLIKGKTRSADTFRLLRVGQQQTIIYNGWRIGITSNFKNITEVR